MDSKIRTVLALSPHTDDAEYGCGGLIAKLTQEHQCRVICVAFSAAEESVDPAFDRQVLREEAPAAGLILGIDRADYRVLNFKVRKLDEARQEILELLVKLRSEFAPDLVLLPSSFDTHQDHAVIYTEGFRAFKKTRMLGYEIPWNCRSFEPSCLVPLTNQQIDTKVRAFEQFKSQTGRPYSNELAIRSIAATNGLRLGSGYAEAFEVIRWLLD